MKNTYVRVFSVLALVLLLLIGATVLGVADGIMILSLPFVLLGKGLRALSLASGAGNVIAIVIYVQSEISGAEDLLLNHCIVYHCEPDPGHDFSANHQAHPRRIA